MSQTVLKKEKIVLCKSGRTAWKYRIIEIKSDKRAQEITLFSLFRKNGKTLKVGLVFKWLKILYKKAYRADMSQIPMKMIVRRRYDAIRVVVLIQAIAKTLMPGMSQQSKTIVKQWQKMHRCHEDKKRKQLDFL
jgi:hypothetical protein